MGYYVRAFCQSEDIPQPEAVEDALRRSIPHVRLAIAEPSALQGWRSVELHYKPSKEPIIVEINVNDGPQSLVAEERREFLDEIGDPSGSDAKLRVVEHLRGTRYIGCCQLLGDIDDDGFEANGQLLDHFVEYYRGMIQADGEGFYDGSDLIVELK